MDLIMVEYDKIGWMNNSTTPLNANNLNRMDDGIYKISLSLNKVESNLDKLLEDETIIDCGSASK